jgi:hypothetical protein
MANETSTFVVNVINTLLIIVNGDTSAITSIAHRHHRY